MLIAGSDEVWSLERFYVRYLAEAGVEVRTIPVQSIFYEYYNRGLGNKLLFKAGLSSIGKTIGKKMDAAIEEWQPDCIWVFKGMELTAKHLRRIKHEGIFLANYNPDNPFYFSGSGSGNRNVSESIGVYDLHFSYDRQICSRIGQEYKIPCAILPFGFELSEGLYEECRKQEEIQKICFLGNPDEQRAKFLQELAGSFPLDVYGEGWEKFASHPNITAHPPVYAEGFWKTLARYRIQLNLMRPHNPDSHNMRSFEVPGVGGIGLFPRTQDHASYFIENKELFLYGSVVECKEKAAAILKMNPTEAGGIRLAARQKSIEAGYSYRDRALQMLAELKKYRL